MGSIAGDSIFELRNDRTEEWMCFTSKIKNASAVSREATELLARPDLVILNHLSEKFPCHLPLPAVCSVTNTTALAMLLESAKFRFTVFSEIEEQDCNSWHPFSVAHAAMTQNPFLSSHLASEFPSPVSQPVMKTCFPFKFLTLYLSLMIQ